MASRLLTYITLVSPVLTLLLLSSQKSIFNTWRQSSLNRLTAVDGDRQPAPSGPALSVAFQSFLDYGFAGIGLTIWSLSQLAEPSKRLHGVALMENGFTRRRQRFSWSGTNGLTAEGSDETIGAAQRIKTKERRRRRCFEP